MPIPDGTLIKGLTSARSRGHRPITFKLLLSREDLLRLLGFAQCDPQRFTNSLQESLENAHIAGRSKKPECPIGLERVMQIPDGVRIIGLATCKTRAHEGIRFRLSTTREDLTRLLSFSSSDWKKFIGSLLEFIGPALNKIARAKEPRGPYYGRGFRLWLIRHDLHLLYYLFRHACRMEKPPLFLQRVLADIGRRGASDTYKGEHRGKAAPDPLAIAAYCVERFCERQGFSLPSVGVKSFIERIEDPAGGGVASAYHHQIREWARVHKDLIEDIDQRYKRCATPAELDGFVHKHAFVSDLLYPYLR